MKRFFVFLFISLLALLETTISPFSLVILAIIYWAAILKGRKSLLIAFFSGLILDFFGKGPFGLSSLFFVILAFLIILYKNRFQAEKFRFLLPFTFFSLLFFDLTEGILTISPKGFFENIINTFLVFLFLPFLKALNYNSQKEKLKLEL